MGKKQRPFRIEAATVVRYWFAGSVHNAVLPSFYLSHPIVPLASTGGYSLLPSNWSTEARCRTSLTHCGHVLGRVHFQLAALGELAILAGCFGGFSWSGCRFSTVGVVVSGGCCCCCFRVEGPRESFFWSIKSASRVSLFTSAASLNSTPLYSTALSRTARTARHW
jgi:hypothetical protein